ncbi:MAG TPA: hypothetical protein VJJ81_03225 [Candidatus Babeliales bacterium]|nr:hypothetical protein [Candidatus Babeliales bacterium]
MKNKPSKKALFNNLTSIILQNAQTLNQLHDAIRRTVKKRTENPQAWQEACAAFHEAWDNHAFPRGGVERGLALLKEHDPETITTAIIYLNADPYFFRSGYIKQSIAHLLKQAPLTYKQIEQIQDFLIAALQRDSRREYREYYRLAAKVADDKFRKRIQEIIEHSDNARHVQQAQQMLDVMNYTK